MPSKIIGCAESIKVGVNTILTGNANPCFKSHFANLLDNYNMKSKATSIRIAFQYSLRFSEDIMKLPMHVRGYGLAGILDNSKKYINLSLLRRCGNITFGGMIQAIEGWIVGDPCEIIADYYVDNDYSLDEWTKEQIENAEWGNSVGAASCIAIKQNRHVDWAIDLIKNRQIGDPSNAIADLKIKNLVSIKDTLEILKNDKIGCPASAAVKLFNRNIICKYSLFDFVGHAVSGKPAQIIYYNMVLQRKEFAEKIADSDIDEFCPNLAIWLVINKGSDYNWAESVIAKSKYKPTLDYVRAFIDKKSSISLVNGNKLESCVNK